MLVCDCPPCPLSSLSPVLAELQQADLITSEECRGLYDSSRVVRVQSGKSPEVLKKLLMFLGDMDLRKSLLTFQVSRHSPSSMSVGCCIVEPGCCK